MASNDVMIETRGLTKKYGLQRAIDQISFEIRRGEVVGFLGPNGAGKSTTMKILTCFIAPSEGVARVGGYDVFDDPLAVRSVVGYLPAARVALPRDGRGGVPGVCRRPAGHPEGPAARQDQAR
jgi:ABC-type multidrug transport system ATPase subunit